MNHTKHSEHWRWMLVDALAHGRKYWPCRVKNTEKLSEIKGTEGDILARSDDAIKALNTQKDWKSVQNAYKVRDDLDSEIQKLDKLFLQFGVQEQQKILTTPRFDITGYAFVQNQIPGNWEEYLKTLPALSIPFSDFWLEWTSIHSQGEFKFATRCQKIRETDTGKTIMIETFIDVPRDVSESNKDICLLVDADLELDHNHKAIELKSNNNSLALFLPVIHSLALLSCRNVQTIEINPPRQIRRQVERSHGVAMCSYKIIKITHQKVKRVGAASEQPDNGKSTRPFSIHRGHFKTYDEKGLFGKLKGTWWWDDYAVGDKEYGVITKDYVLENK